MTLTPKGYIRRLQDAVLSCRLEEFGAVEVSGPKFCGKTWTSLNHGNSIIHIDDDADRQMVELDATLALQGKHPHVIDEWQDVPKVWDAVRRAVDENANQPGEFLLTGSSTVDKSKVSHSGAGRISELRMRTMSLQESGDSDAKISLSGLFEGEFEKASSKTSAKELAEYICRGGWPAGINKKTSNAIPSQYLNALFEVSASKCGLYPRLARRIAMSLARNLGKPVTYKTLYQDVFETDEVGNVDQSIFRQEIDPYLSFFRHQYFIEEQEGWDAPIKSKSRLRKKPRRCFADPSLPAALLGVDPTRLLREGQLFGNLFEEMCLRDLRVYTSALGMIPDPDVRYYSDADGLEVDAVIELPDGRWAAFEVKLSDQKVPEGVKSLLRLKRKISLNPAARNPEPEFMAVIVGVSSFAFETPEGVYVIPITSLGA